MDLIKNILEQVTIPDGFLEAAAIYKHAIERAAQIQPVVERYKQRYFDENELWSREIPNVKKPSFRLTAFFQAPFLKAEDAQNYFAYLEEQKREHGLLEYGEDVCPYHHWRARANNAQKELIKAADPILRRMGSGANRVFWTPPYRQKNVAELLLRLASACADLKSLYSSLIQNN